MLPHLVHKGAVQEVRPPDAQVDDVDARVDGKVEGVQEPAGVRDLHTIKEGAQLIA